jgi:cysteinyl-tRNA synthetase
MHGEFLVVDQGKMSKSTGNFLTLKVVTDQGFSPLHYRYLCLGAHYRSQLFFSWKALQGAKNAFESLKNRVISWKLIPQKGSADARGKYQKKFWEALANDLDMPVVMACVWEMAKDTTLSNADKLELIREFDQVLGFDVESFSRPELSSELKLLMDEREEARAKKDWKRADELRQILSAQGVALKDTANGTDWYLSDSLDMGAGL